MPRSKPQRLATLLRASIVLLTLSSSLSVAACKAGDAPTGPVEIEVTGIEHEWYVRYPGVDGALGTEDDRFGQRDVLLPVDAPVTLHLRSEDYVYFFELPDLNMQEAAMPGAELSLSMTTTVEVALPIEMDTMCGLPYEEVERNVRVLSARDYRDSMAQLDSTDAAMATAIAGLDILEADLDFALRTPEPSTRSSP